MLVKDQLTGKKAPRDTLYRVENINKNGTITAKYYTSKEAYEEWCKDKEWKKKSVDMIFKLLGYNDGCVAPGVLFKEIEKYRGMGFEVLYNTIISTIGDVEWAIANKEFHNEVAKIKYIMAIYSNHAIDEYRALKTKKTDENVVPPDDEHEIIRTHKQKVKDISQWID